MKNLEHLAEKNEALLDSLNFNPLYDDPFALDDPHVFRATGLFPESAVDTIFSDNDEINDDFSRYAEMSRHIGMLLIRPDMVHATNRVERFLSERYVILESEDVTVSSDRYWAMYKDAITSRETTQSRLTRAAVYINSPCRLIVVGESTIASHAVPLADQIFRDIKGTQGVYAPNTLRGDIVYRTALESGFHDMRDPMTALAVDPFGAYRKIVSTGLGGRSADLQHPLLFYNGVGVHVPNHDEMKRDLALFDSTEQAYAA